MKKLKALIKNKKIYRFVYGIICSAVIFMSLSAMTLIEQENNNDFGAAVFVYDASIMAMLFMGIFLLMFLSRVLSLASGVYADEKTRSKRIKNRLYVIAYFAAIISLICISDRELGLKTAFNLYFGSILVGRAIPSILKLTNKNYQKRKRKIIPVLFWIYVFYLVTKVNMNMEHENFAMIIYMCAGMIMFHYLCKVIIVTFSSIKLDILKKIIRKSYAVEILSGLAVLIFSVALVLKNYEPSMKTMGDALWYCFALITTIGFGDYTAVTGLGRILSVILGIYGIFVISMITSIFVNFYTETKDSGDDDDDDDDDDDEETEEIPQKTKKLATKVGGMTIITNVDEDNEDENDEKF